MTISPKLQLQGALPRATEQDPAVQVQGPGKSCLQEGDAGTVPLSEPVYQGKSPHGGAMPQCSQGHHAAPGEAAEGDASERRSSEHPFRQDIDNVSLVILDLEHKVDSF